MAELKTVTILGSTGSVGQSTVDLIRSQPDVFSVQALTCNRNIEKLAEQAINLNARAAIVADETLYQDLKSLLSGTNIGVAAGEQAVIEAASMPADWTMAAIVGMAGLEPILAAIAQGKIVAIANKEPLVAAGPLVLDAARISGAKLLPVDSEHNAIFQVFEEQNRPAIEKIFLTASGGPFRTWSRDEMEGVTPEQAVAHPNWSMGAKISVDSATMMNKALEIIEAHYLFDMPLERIDVVIHPQSIVHSMVSYEDGSVLAQMGAPDMRTPIAYALAWPQRMKTTGQFLDFSRVLSLDFEPVDTNLFPSISMAYECLRASTAHCIAFNAANEMAVAAFLEKRLGFLQIFDTIRAIVDITEKEDFKGLAAILNMDDTVRRLTAAHIDKTYRS